MLPPAFPGLSQEKIAAFTQRLRAEPRYLLAQNVSTCIDPLEVCLHRQTVQDTVHTFQHSIPTEGKPVTNQKNSGMLDLSRKMGMFTGSSQDLIVSSLSFNNFLISSVYVVRLIFWISTFW